MSTRWLLQARKALLYRFILILCRIPAKTRARGYMVSRFPLGICITRANIDGMTVTSLAPRSMLRQRSSNSGVSGGTSNSSSNISVAHSRRSVALPSTLDICTNFKRCWLVVKIKCAGVTKKDVQFRARMRSFAIRSPLSARPKITRPSP